MALIKLGLDKLPIPDKIQFARQIVTDMTGNPNFTTPLPALTGITAAALALETAYNAAQTARQVAKSATATQDVKNDALNLILSQEANYVENTSNGDKAKILSSGFDVRNPSTPIGVLPQVADLSAGPSEDEGSADLAWTGVRGAKSYAIERAPNSADLQFVMVGTSTKTKTSLNTMTPGNKYWFRVAAVGAAGQGAWSDPVPIIAP
ncbi:MAG: hypothetical protein JWQ71_3460 [Pedosphaera sp.]|nr:hypothetical protein [Pedosphaera sp.]